MNEHQPVDRSQWAGELNSSAAALLSDTAALAAIGVKVSEVAGARVFDFAVGRSGSVEAGILLSRICLGDAAEVSFSRGSESDTAELLTPELATLGLDAVTVLTDHPLAACMGGQYAGWPIGTHAFFAMGSGPFRMFRGEEAVLDEYRLVAAASSGQAAVGVLEANQLPDEETIEYIASECGVACEDLRLCVARTASLPGTIQVVARSVETTLHKLHELNFDLGAITRGRGVAVVPPVADDDMTALGWTNDAILYGAKVELEVSTSDAAVDEIIERLPSCSSAEFGTPFLEIFNRFDKDFYKIDKLLFSPAEVVINNTSTGRTSTAGARRADVLQQSFGMK